MSHSELLNLSSRAAGTAYSELAIGRVPKLCSYTSHALGLMSNAPTTRASPSGRALCSE